jgi:hypothetical protein
MDRPENPPMTPEQRMAWLANIKDGDWLYYEFELSQVDDNGVTNGAVYTGCSIDRHRSELDFAVQPLDMRIKRISESFRTSYDKLHQLNCNSLNYPELHALWVRMWVEFCNGVQPRDQAGVWPFAAYKEVEAAVKSIRSGPAIGGVRIFGR